MPQSLYLIRHATPDWSRKDIPYHIPPGPPLTAQGQTEAQALGAFLISAGVCRLYTSPLERCHNTAQIAADIAGIPWQMDEALIEWQPGDTTASVQERLSGLVDCILHADLAAGPVGLVTHGGPVGALLMHLGMEEQHLNQYKTFDHGNPLPPAGAWQAERSRSDEAWGLRLAFTPQVQPEANPQSYL
jgi:broad specificity phosphatase PhoE